MSILHAVYHDLDLRLLQAIRAGTPGYRMLPAEHSQQRSRQPHLQEHIKEAEHCSEICRDCSPEAACVIALTPLRTGLTARETAVTAT